MRKVDIFDTTLRDGGQSPGCGLNAAEKLEIAHQLTRLGVDVIEAGFAASSPGDFAAIKTIAEQVRGPVITALVRGVKDDIDVVAKAVKPAERPRIYIVVSASNIHLERKMRKSKDAVLQMGVDSVRYARNLCGEVEYSTEDASRADLDYRCRTLEEVIKAGATVVNIPDTVGFAVPGEWYETFAAVMHRVPNIDKVKISVVITILAWPWPTPWKPFALGRSRWKGVLMASASALGMLPSKKVSWPSTCGPNITTRARTSTCKRSIARAI
jgi:2-isopropylmalate synthase